MNFHLCEGTNKSKIERTPPNASIVAFRYTRPPIERITESNSRFYFFPSQLAHGVPVQTATTHVNICSTTTDVTRTFPAFEIFYAVN